MTIAAISDIYSNVFALEAVLVDIKHRAVSQIVTLGDILYGSIVPKATHKLLMANQQILLLFVAIRIEKFMELLQRISLVIQH